ncbi:hypothetical protein, partial [Pseudomonas aeruginosa]|uniref:hypothetical protein n=1 Tax=Pseudomonas aeruginosa TaxID=287 RepID=UPI002574D8E8
RHEHGRQTSKKQKGMTKPKRHYVCHFCGKHGHIAPFCYKRFGYPNEGERKTQKAWMPKDKILEQPNSFIHPKGPKRIWVPKST